MAHYLSAECTKSELDLFKAPYTQLSIDQTSYVEISPLNSVESQEVLDFVIPGAGSFYLDLNNTLLQLRLKVTKADGTNLAADDACSIINYPLNTIFSQVDLSLNDVLISSSSATHPYRSIIETLLNYSENALKTMFSAGLFFKDTGNLDSINMADGGPNRGLIKRSKFCERSKEFEVIGPLHTDLFFSERLLLNNIDIRLKLVKAKSSFSLMCAADKDYELKILSASLFVKKVEVSPAVMLGHTAALHKANALYPVSQITVKNYTVPAQSRVCSQDNLFLGRLPRYVVIGLVDHAAFVGSRELNPFRFQHWDIEYLTLTANGKNFPQKPYQPNFERGNCVREFYNLFLATNRHLKDSGLCIGRDEFQEGYTLFVLNLSRDDELDGEVISPAVSGTCRMDIRFRTALPRPVTVIVYACFDSIIEVNAKRQILVDF